MAAEFDRIPLPAGSKVIISDKEGNVIAGGALLEEYTVSLNSEFGQLVDTGENNAFTVLGGALKSLSGSRFGFSSQFKQMGFQIWKSTAPIQLQFSLEFHYTYNAYEEVKQPIKRLCQLPLPGEGPMGNLIPPGPSIIEAITGPGANNMPPPSEGIADNTEVEVKGEDNYVNIRIGGMLFLGCVITQAEPTFSKRVDESNSPIYGRVAMTAITMYSATKEAVASVFES